MIGDSCKAPHYPDRPMSTSDLITPDGQACKLFQVCWGGRQRSYKSAVLERGRRGSQRSGKGLVSRASPVQTAVRNCTRDEGGPFEAGSQVQVSSHRKLLSSRAMVVLCQEGARAPCCTRDEGRPFGAVL